MVWKNWVHAFNLGLWLVAGMLAAASPRAWHSVALLVGNPATITSGTTAGRWHMVGYLDPDCASSWEVARYLAGRRPVGCSSIRELRTSTAKGMKETERLSHNPGVRWR
jgi:hypothetical protein